MKRRLSSFINNLQARPFEQQVWLVVTAVAGLRSLKAVVQDILNGSKGVLLIDIFILTTFCAVFLAIYFERIKRIPTVVGIILLLLLIVSYIQFGGVAGTSEYNLMALGVLFALAYNRKELIWMMSVYVVIVVAANLDIRMQGYMSSLFFKNVSSGLDTYFTTLITLLILMFYFKKALINESARVMELRKELGDRIKIIERQNNELKEQQHLLQKINKRLEREIKNHNTQINHQDRAIRDFIWLSTESLEMPLQRIVTNLEDLNENDAMETQLKGQVSELRSVIQNLKQELVHHEDTRR